MILAVYSALLAAALVVGAPWWLVRMTTTGRYRAGLAGRLGKVPSDVAGAVAGRKVLWLHAVSVGEVMAATELIREIRRRMPDWVIAISTTTETGQRLARERFASHSPVFYMPLDFSILVRRYLQVLHPEMVVLMESELWPNLIDVCASRGIPIAVINARISDRSLPRYLRLKRLWQPVLKRMSLVLAQSEENGSRFLQIGAPADRVTVTGNLKYDVRAPETTPMTARLREILPSTAKIIVAGSTLEGEEKMLLDEWPKVLEEHPDAVLILAPRRPERFNTVAEYVETTGFDLVRVSELGQYRADHRHEGIILLDSIGDLASVYSLGRVAFVGGSLVPMGGHNPLEPARFGIPVVMGRSSENFREIVDAMRSANAIRIVEPVELGDALSELLRNESEAGQVGERGRQVFFAQAGATARTVECLLGLLKRKTS
ncbi:MAG TPA: 3-deoxy-D-manno-octulosonic acid transferase [Edaphobacter sp.]|nr:3-deoxy-D-manno-octulosonic acid transferase [Edaphobacter sp.]